MAKENRDENYNQFNNEFDEPINSFNDSIKNGDEPINSDVNKESITKFVNVVLLLIPILMLITIIGPWITIFMDIAIAKKIVNILFLIVYILLVLTIIIGLYVFHKNKSNSKRL